MKMNDVVFTTHSIERMKQRGIHGDWAYQTVKVAEITKAGKEKHTSEFIKKFGKYTVTVIAKKNDISEWVVLSVWMDPPLEGTQDHYKKIKYIKNVEHDMEYRRNMQKASFWRKLWLTFKKQAGF